MKRRLGELGPRIYTGLPEAYECLGCGHEWRQPLPENGTSCPKCDHLYVEWLSFDISPARVYFVFDDIPIGWACLRKIEDNK